MREAITFLAIGSIFILAIVIVGVGMTNLNTRYCMERYGSDWKGRMGLYGGPQCTNSKTGEGKYL